MTLIDVVYQAGTQKSPQQTKISAPAFTDTDHVHFPDGRLTTLPPYSAASLTSDYVTFLGGVRSVHAIKITGANVGTYFLFGSNTRLYVAKNSTLYNITPLSTVAAATLGTDPLTTVNTDFTLTVAYTSHGLAVGDRIRLSGATNVGGVTAATYINIEHIVATVPTANTFTVEMGFAATSNATGGGGAVQIFKQIAAGNLDQDLATGYGVGEYGEGVYGVGGASLTAQIYPRIWSFGNFGNEVVMCPGDYTTGDGQKIYIWDGSVTTAPTILTNAPTDCNWVSVVNNSVVACCGETIKISEQGDATVWSGITYYEKSLERVWKVISCHAFNDKNAVLFTPNEAILLRYVGGGDIWDLSDLYLDDGAIAPLAACMLDAVMYWRGYRGSYMYNGAPPTRIENAQNDSWIIENTNYGKTWKSFAMPDPENHEWYFYFASSAYNEPSDYVIHNTVNGSHTLGLMNRTAAQRPTVIDSTFYMANSTSTSVAGSVYRHFTLGAVTFNWYAETSMAYGFGGENRVMVDKFFPDSNQSGTITLNMMTKEYPQGATTTSSSYSVTPSLQWLSVKAAGKLVGMKFSGTGSFTTGAWKMNITKLGRRN